MINLKVSYFKTSQSFSWIRFVELSSITTIIFHLIFFNEKNITTINYYILFFLFLRLFLIFWYDICCIENEGCTHRRHSTSCLYSLPISSCHSSCFLLLFIPFCQGRPSPGREGLPWQREPFPGTAFFWPSLPFPAILWAFSSLPW